MLDQFRTPFTIYAIYNIDSNLADIRELTMLRFLRARFLLKTLETTIGALAGIGAQKSSFWKTLFGLAILIEIFDIAMTFLDIAPMLSTFLSIAALGFYQIVIWQIILGKAVSFWPSGRFSTALGIIVLPTFIVSIATIILFFGWLRFGGGAAWIVDMLPEELKTPEGFQVVVVYFGFLACLPGIVFGTYAMVRLSPLLQLEHDKSVWNPSIWAETWKRAKPFAWITTFSLFFATLFASLPGHILMSLQIGGAGNLIAFAILKAALIVAPALVLKLHIDRMEVRQQSAI